MNWNESLKGFKHYLKFERNFADNTLEAYLSDLNKLRDYVSKNMEGITPKNITYEQLQEYLYNLSKQKISERSQSRLISSIKTYFKYLTEEEIREDNPSVLLESPKLGLYLPDTLSMEDVERVINSIDSSTAIGKRNLCMIEMLYGCGLRVSELIDLKISNINFKESYLIIKGKGSKIRFVPMTEYTQNILYEYTKNIRSTVNAKKKDEDIVFLNNRGSKISRVMVFLIIKKLSKKGGINKNISPHTFRHSFATHLMQNGADLRYIQEMLGHSSITTTEIYTHLKNEELRDVILNFHPRNITV